MTSRIAFFLLSGMLTSAFGAASIDLTPEPRIIKLEGATRHGVEFHSFRPEKQVQYTPAWPLSGTGDKATFAIPDLGATGEIVRLDTLHPLDLSDDAAVAEWVKGAAPKGSENVQIVKTLRDLVFINGQPTVEVQLTYSLFGLSVTQAMLLVRRATSDPTELLCFRVETVHPEQFAKLDRALIRSLYSIIGF
jgi:hypothetical protein